MLHRKAAPSSLSVLWKSALQIMTPKNTTRFLNRRKQKARHQPGFLFQDAMVVSAFVDNDVSFLEHNTGIQHVPEAVQWIAIYQNDIGKLASFQGAQVILHVDIGR